MITIRRLKKGEAGLYKRVRLAALKEAPFAFGSTFEGALQKSEEAWIRQADEASEGSDRAIFVVVDEEKKDFFVGLTALYRSPQTQEEEEEEGKKKKMGEILQVWVHPEYRGKKVAMDLMNHVFQWGKENHFRRIIANVSKTNLRAIGFYEKFGFQYTDEFPADGPDEFLLIKNCQ
eukprot:CAMPEP_0201483700 /NCGR_PEP_ID=MMETSP0151_2-20130828/7903_1 /ASSEMBLY_ACC=CAM_ASM_000257 /TAXON_ID=200890 /ORGANISM="Paramoeba atlantica, Strain 621/1 / CCAP 1560/9" /LENGTH=175 /DNA_ID=CAMNT_0047866977 /DNA_START=25 /DNA_END=552 /DNA_ORIENTATION=-